MSNKPRTRAIDVDCPNGHAPAGTYCNGAGIGADLCTARINAARARTQGKPAGVTVDQLRELRDVEHQWITNHPGAMTTNYAEYVQHTYAFRQAQVALGEQRARRGSSKADARARCAEILKNRLVSR